MSLASVLVLVLVVFFGVGFVVGCFLFFGFGSVFGTRVLFLALVFVFGC